MTKIEPVERPMTIIKVPGSKSYSQRALVVTALVSGQSKLHNVLVSEDTKYLIKALRSLGARILRRGENLVIEGTGGSIANPGKDIFLGNNGTALRFLTSLVCLGKGHYELTGSARLRERPIDPLLDALKTLGVKGYSRLKKGYPPVVIEANGLPGGSVTMSDVESSQYVSSLLLSAPYAQRDVEIKLAGRTVSRPYIDMTLQVMNKFGIEVARGEKDDSYLIKCGQSYKARHYLIEGDVSSASYFFLAAALGRRRIRVININPKNIQGDIGFVDILETLGCLVVRGDSWIEVEGKAMVEGDYEFSMRDMPDMAPTIAVISAFRKGRTVIADVAHLRIKESDRIAAAVTELKKIGIHAEERTDGMVITGGRPHGAKIETYNDHRMAMSFAIAGLVVPGIEIADRDCVKKSFPGFWDELRKL